MVGPMDHPHAELRAREDLGERREDRRAEADSAPAPGIRRLFLIVGAGRGPDARPRRDRSLDRNAA